MPPRIYLALALHNHQPVGNFGWVFEEAYRTSYLPMVECLERHPGMRLALHYTGPLRDWLLENHSEFFPRLSALVGSGQVEILSGAYYEPVLASLLDADKVGQIQKQTESIRQDFGYEATGMWLAERIWEPHLPRPLNQAGIQYTIVDDTHFKNVGYTEEELFGYYVTEEQGYTLKIFATPKKLRELLPWGSVEEIVGWLREKAEAPDPKGLYLGRTKVAIFGDDGEKFGLWPGTYDHIWTRGWMDSFFTALTDNADWLGTISPGEFARQYPSLGRVYLPTASYEEMGEWALPAEAAWELPHLKHALISERPDVVRYMRGGLWRNFMVKYPEVNQLHKKAIYVSRKVHAMPEGEPKHQALDHLWAGECNCGYWHGLFGGIYLFHIRVADYQHLIHAENLADGLDDGAQSFARAETVDFNLDGIDDVAISTDVQTLIFDLDKGGALVEWDFRAVAYNLLNVLTRRIEGYHRNLVEAAERGEVETPDNPILRDRPESIHSNIVRARETGLEQRLIYDWYRRASLVDHFLGESVTLDSFYRSSYPEQGDFVNQAYRHEIEQSAIGVTVRLWREGCVWRGSEQIPVTVEKTLQIEAGSPEFRVVYRVINGDAGDLDTRFGVETNWGLAGGNDQHTYLSINSDRLSLGEMVENDSVKHLKVSTDLWGFQVNVKVEQPAMLWGFPLESVSASEGGFERNYQGTTLLLWWPIQLGVGQSWQTTLTFNLSQIRN